MIRLKNENILIFTNDADFAFFMVVMLFLMFFAYLGLSLYFHVMMSGFFFAHGLFFYLMSVFGLSSEQN
jgi:hypothetical protein